MKKYIVEENDLRRLLSAAARLAILDADGVDNWWGYLEGHDECVAQWYLELPGNEDKCLKDAETVVRKGYSYHDLANDELKMYEEYIEKN